MVNHWILAAALAAVTGTAAADDRLWSVGNEVTGPQANLRIDFGASLPTRVFLNGLNVTPAAGPAANAAAQGGIFQGLTMLEIGVVVGSVALVGWAAYEGAQDDESNPRTTGP